MSVMQNMLKWSTQARDFQDLVEILLSHRESSLIFAIFQVLQSAMLIFIQTAVHNNQDATQTSALTIELHYSS